MTTREEANKSIDPGEAEAIWPLGWYTPSGGRHCTRAYVRGVRVELFFRDKDDGGGYGAAIVSAHTRPDLLHADSLAYLLRDVRERMLLINSVVIPPMAPSDSKDQLWRLLLKVINSRGTGWVPRHGEFALYKSMEGSDSTKYEIRIEKVWHGFRLFLLFCSEVVGATRRTTLAVHELSDTHTEAAVITAVEGLFSQAAGLPLVLKKEETPVVVEYPGNVKIY